MKELAGDEYLLSIITVVYNGGESFKNTLKSIEAKKNKCVEYLVIDGGSKDETINHIDKFKEVIDYWVSEPDKGIYDAMNKGIQQANGKYIYFLNAGDILLELPLKQLAYSDKNNIGVACFQVSLSNNNIFYPEPGFKLKISNTMHHQGTFYQKKIIEPYDLNYKVFADFDLNQKLFMRKVNFHCFENLIAFHSLDGISHNKAYFNEVFKIIRKNFGLNYVFLSFIYFKWKGALSWKKKLKF